MVEVVLTMPCTLAFVTGSATDDPAREGPLLQGACGSVSSGSWGMA